MVTNNQKKSPEKDALLTKKEKNLRLWKQNDEQFYADFFDELSDKPIPKASEKEVEESRQRFLKKVTQTVKE